MTARNLWLPVLVICFGFGHSFLNAQQVETKEIGIRYINWPSDYFERCGMTVPFADERTESKLTVRCAVLSDIEAYFLVQGPSPYSKLFEVSHGQWTAYRTPDNRPFLKSLRKPEYESREIGVKVQRLEGTEKYTVETCEIENNRFANSTYSFAVLNEDQVSLIPIRGHGFIDVRVLHEK